MINAIVFSKDRACQCDLTLFSLLENASNIFDSIHVLYTFSNDKYIVEALRLGAKGYILKQDFESIIPALEAAQNGQNVFGDAIVTKLSTLVRNGQKPNMSDLGITKREEEIMEMVAKGLNNRDIANALYLSEGTVRNYVSAILDKLDLKDRTQLAIFYLRSVE